MVIGDSADCYSGNTVRGVSPWPESLENIPSALSSDAADPDPTSWDPASGSDFVSSDTRRQHTQQMFRPPPAVLFVGGLSELCSDSISPTAWWRNNTGVEVKLYVLMYT